MSIDVNLLEEALHLEQSKEQRKNITREPSCDYTWHKN